MTISILLAQQIAQLFSYDFDGLFNRKSRTFKG